jgi:hypothetical protein
MKWLQLIISFIATQFLGAKIEGAPHPIEEFKELVKENILKILLALTAATVVGSFFVAGFSIVIVDLVYQYNLDNKLKISPITICGFILIIFSLVTFSLTIFFATKHTREKRKMETKRAEHEATNLISNAVMLLINDYIAEREYERESKRRHEVNKNETKEEPPKEEPQVKSAMMNFEYQSTEEFIKH